MAEICLYFKLNVLPSQLFCPELRSFMVPTLAKELSHLSIRFAVTTVVDTWIVVYTCPVEHISKISVNLVFINHYSVLMVPVTGKIALHFSEP